MDIVRKEAQKIKPCIYKITSPNSRVYIGQTVNFWRRYRSYKSNHITLKNQVKLYNSFQKHGFENHVFEIVIECDKIELNENEIYYINLFKSSSKNGLNCRGGGKSIHTQSKETILKRSKSLKGKVCSKEKKQKISEANKGENNGMFGKTPWNKGKKHSKETIEKLRKSFFKNPPPSRKGIKHTEETLKLISEKTKGKNKGFKNKSFKGFILAYDKDGIFLGKYEGLKMVEESLGFPFRQVSRVLLGKRKNYNGFTFVRENAISKQPTNHV